MNYRTFSVQKEASIWHILLKTTVINALFLKEINLFLDEVEQDESFILLLTSDGEIFLAGMDLKEMSDFDDGKMDDWIDLYFKTLKRFTTYTKCIISFVKGKVIAGGLGFLAASDLCFANQNAIFKLTELYWGLLPAMVAPFLIRKIGFNHAYSLTLLSKTFSARQAFDIHLLNGFEEDLIKTLEHFQKIDLETIKQFKSYFNSLYDLSKEENKAKSTTKTLLLQPSTQSKIKNFVKTGKLPF